MEGYVERFASLITKIVLITMACLGYFITIPLVVVPLYACCDFLRLPSIVKLAVLFAWTWYYYRCAVDALSPPAKLEPLMPMSDNKLAQPMYDIASPKSPVTVFYAGNGNSIEQAAKYVGNHQVAGHSHPLAPYLLYNVYDALPGSDPVDVERSFVNIPWWCIPTVLWMRASRWWNGIQESRLDEHYSLPSYINIPKINFAQADDVLKHQEILGKVIERSQQPIVLFGCSRGASTTLVSVLALFKTKPEMLERVRGVILEAPFSSVPDILEYRYSAFLAPLVHALLGKLTSYDCNLASPLELAQTLDWPSHIPLLIVSSQVDTSVPFSSTMRLIKALQERNKEIRITTPILTKSPHGSMSVDNVEDIKRYRTAVDTFYSKIFVKDNLWTHGHHDNIIARHHNNIFAHSY